MLSYIYKIKFERSYLSNALIKKNYWKKQKQLWHNYVYSLIDFKVNYILRSKGGLKLKNYNPVLFF